MIKQQIDQDLKSAMLAGDKQRVSTLRGLKSTILYGEVAGSKEKTELGEQEVISLLRKESKKRQEAAELYAKGGNPERQQAELAEKDIIESYLPAVLSEAEINKLIDEVVANGTELARANLGQIIGQVKSRSQGAADGAQIAKIVNQRIANAE